MMNDEYQI